MRYTIARCHSSNLSQLLVSTLGQVCLWSTIMQREATTLNCRNVLVKICFEIWQKSAQMKTAADSPVLQHLFICFCLDINFNPFKIDKGTFLSCCPIRNYCPNHYIYTSKIVSCIFLDKILTSPFWNYSIHAPIINNSIGAFKQEKTNK